tara:strand:- start:574 stop:1521 length:948 start_codon:yes stop_codon:yes gene_type:complete
MAVFTKLHREEIEDFLSSYNIGKLETFTEIVEGIENTNYKIICNQTPYILTIFEKRVKKEDLPFFIDLKLFLSKNNFKCPKPISNKNKNIINSIKNKKAVIISFIDGNKIDKPNNQECFEVGKMIGNLHNISKNFDKRKENNLDLKELKKIFSKCINNNQKEFNLICKELEKEIIYLENSLPRNLPAGIIHADLFKDNIFFENERITGVIDFYFSCYYFYLYDICIVINDWCFEDNGKNFNVKFFKSIIEGYTMFRSLEDFEMESLNIILRVAAVRILITRLHDYLFHPNDAILIKKNPFEYYNILKWHQINTNF